MNYMLYFANYVHFHRGLTVVVNMCIPRILSCPVFNVAWVQIVTSYLFHIWCLFLIDAGDLLTTYVWNIGSERPKREIKK